MTTRFADQVAAWCRSVETTATTVLRESARSVAAEAGDHAGPGDVADDIRRQLNAGSGVRLGTISTILAEHDRAQTLNYGFTVTDAWRGAHSQPGRNFIQLAARRWPRIVRAATQRFKR